MNEWEVFLVIVALVGFAIAVGTPIVKLNTTIIRLIERIGSMDEGLDELTARNSRSHERIWKHSAEQDKQIADHEKRIYGLEKEKE